MNSIKKIIFTVCSFLLLASCNPEDNIVIVESPFAKFTERDINGALVPGGEVDSTDWGIASNFTVAENLLFADTNTKQPCFIPFVHEIKAFPNPSNGTFQFVNFADTTFKLKLRIVNTSNTLVYSYTGPNYPLQIAIAGPLVNFQTLRCYYKIVNKNDSCEFSGFGDLHIKK